MGAELAESRVAANLGQQRPEQECPELAGFVADDQRSGFLLQRRA